MPKNKPVIVAEKYQSVCRKAGLGIMCVLLLVVFAAFVHADSVSAAANSKLTDGATASSNPSDAAWVSFSKDSTQLPLALGSSPNLNFEFFGTGEYLGSSAAAEASIEQLMRDAGSRSIRLNVLCQVFPDPAPNGAPYWDWSWYDNSSDGQRIQRAIHSGEMVDLVVNKTAFWESKSLPLEHPPISNLVQEQVTLNGTTPVQLSHNLLMGEKNPLYDKEGVVAVSAATQSVTGEYVGTGNGSTWQEFSLKNAYVVPGSLKLYVNGVLWSEVNFFHGSNTLDKQAYVFFPNTGRIRFGDGWTGPILPSGASITAQYSYFTNPYKEYSGATYNTTDQLDYRIDYTNGTIQRTQNSSIPSGATVKVSYYYLDTTMWQNFWQELTNHYAGQAKYFEVQNEENLDQSWTGTQAQYAQMLRTAYIGAKQGNPDAVVLLGGLGWGTDYLSKLYAMNTKNYFDVLAWHPYGWQIGPDNPQSIYNILNNNYFASAAANGDSAKPVFFNEIGYSTSQQVGMTWAQQGIALSRTYMRLLRDQRVVNASWWGIVDESPIGQQESNLYFSHLGLMAYNAQGNLQIKPSYYTYKSLGTNKGVIIDLASYDSSGNVTQGQFAVNKVSFSSLGNDLANAMVFYSQSNSNDWQQVSGANMAVVQNGSGTYTYTITFPAVTTRFVQVQFVKKTGVSNYFLDEVQVFSTSGTNVALNKYYAAAGFDPGAGSVNFGPEPSNPSPNFTYTIDQANKQVILTNTSTPGTANITGYLWFNNSVQISSSVNYNYPTSQNTTLNICLNAYYTGGDSGYVTTKCQTISTGNWSTASANPTSKFTYTIDPANRQVILTNQSTPGSATITGYLWFNKGTQISSSINYNYPSSQNTDLNICLNTYYTGGASGWVQTSCQAFNTGAWGTAANPTPNFTYTINTTSRTLVLTNTTTPGTATITGYLWYNYSAQISNAINYNYPIRPNTTLNICLYAYYLGGQSGYLKTTCKTINTGNW